MHIVTKIRTWLKDGYYLQGVELYRQVGGPFPMTAFEGYEQANFVPEDVERRLRFALEQYVSEAPTFEEEVIYQPKKNVHLAIQKETNQSSEIKTSMIPPPKKTEPDAIQRLRLQAKQLHKRQDDLKSRLNLMVENISKFSDKERYDIAFQLLEEVTPQLDGIYDRIREWQKTGELPAIAKNDIVRDTVQKMQTLGYRKQRISKLRGLLKKNIIVEDRKKYEKELLEKMVEVKGLEEILGMV